LHHNIRFRQVLKLEVLLFSSICDDGACLRAHGVAEVGDSMGVRCLNEVLTYLATGVSDSKDASTLQDAPSFAVFPHGAPARADKFDSLIAHNSVSPCSVSSVHHELHCVRHDDAGALRVVPRYVRHDAKSVSVIHEADGALSVVPPVARHDAECVERCLHDVLTYPATVVSDSKDASSLQDAPSVAVLPHGAPARADKFEALDTDMGACLLAHGVTEVGDSVGVRCLHDVSTYLATGVSTSKDASTLQDAPSVAVSPHGAPARAYKFDSLIAHNSVSPCSVSSVLHEPILGTCGTSRLLAPGVAEVGDSRGGPLDDGSRVLVSPDAPVSTCVSHDRPLLLSELPKIVDVISKQWASALPDALDAIFARVDALKARMAEFQTHVANLDAKLSSDVTSLASLFGGLRCQVDRLSIFCRSEIQPHVCPGLAPDPLRTELSVFPSPGRMKKYSFKRSVESLKVGSLVSFFAALQRRPMKKYAFSCKPALHARLPTLSEAAAFFPHALENSAVSCLICGASCHPKPCPHCKRCCMFVACCETCVPSAESEAFGFCMMCRRLPEAPAEAPFSCGQSSCVSSDGMFSLHEFVDRVCPHDSQMNHDCMSNDFDCGSGDPPFSRVFPGFVGCTASGALDGGASGSSCSWM
jgi:hypothetical protein